MQKPSLNHFVLRAVAVSAIAMVPAAPAMANTNMLTLTQAVPGQDGPDVGETRIVVDGPSKLGYDEVETKTVDMWLRLTLNKVPGVPDKHQIDSVAIESEGESVDATQAFTTKRYKLSFPYADPHSTSVVGQRNSPIDMCNNRMKSLSGAALEKFLVQGEIIKLTSAYPVLARGEANWSTTSGGVFKDIDHHVKYYEDRINAKAVVECKPLGRPRPQTQTSTQGTKPKPGKRMEPTISAATLRMEPAQTVASGGQICPSQLRLYGRVEAIRAFEGKAVIFGPGFLTPVSELNYTHGGNRNIVGTYPLKWDGVGGLAAAGKETPLKSQKVSLTMNVTTADNKVLKQAKTTVTVTCKRIAQVVLVGAGTPPPPPPPVKPDKAAVVPPPATNGRWDGPSAAEPAAAKALRTRDTAFFAKRPKSGLLSGVDAAIRKVDRSGPGGATRLWIRNGGDKSAEQCRLFAKRGDHDKWIIIDSVSMSVAPGATNEIAAALPDDPALTFAVDCAGEEENRLDNNVAKLD